MIRELICIECPAGCRLKVVIKKQKVLDVTGNKCPKGKKYAVSEAESPKRILTSTVLARGLDLKMIPVRTDRPIPKKDVFKGMEKIKKIIVGRPLRTGDVIKKDFMAEGVNLIATRECSS